MLPCMFSVTRQQIKLTGKEFPKGADQVSEMVCRGDEEQFKSKRDVLSVHLHGMKNRVADSIDKCARKPLSSLNSRVSLSVSGFASAALKSQPQPREEEPRL